jgi:quinol monooxygenase YgiN
VRLVVWQFRVKALRALEFERLYGPNGEWARLFARGEGYLGTTLAQDASDPGRFVTIDRWREASDPAAFKARFGPEYQALDERGEGLTREERHLGDFDVLWGSTPAEGQ